jgi:hypothetical protein
MGGLLLLIGLTWCLLALGAAVVLGRVVRMRDLREPGLCIEVPDVAAVDERPLHHV